MGFNHQQPADMFGGALVMAQNAEAQHQVKVEPNNNTAQPETNSCDGMGDPAHPAEIPIWINGAQRWISGIGRKTTCDDVIRVLLRSEGCQRNDAKEEKSCNKHYAIVERWKKVERPLDGRSRILKVWTTWGDEQQAVRLTLKRVNPTTPRDVKTHQHHRRSSRGHNRARLLQTVHPKRLIDVPTDKQFSDTIEHLMKLILAQGETIHSQLQRLHERDEQITNIEDQVHSSRVERLGSNYLLETYLKDLDANKGGEDDSGVAEVEAQPTSSKDSNDAQNDEDGEEEGGEEGGEEAQRALVELRACIALYERVVRVNKRLEKEEQVLVKLHVKLRRLEERESSNAPAQEATEMITNEALAIVREQMEEADAVAAAHQMDIEQNEMRLQETCEQLQARHRLLDCLQEELRESELEEEQLKRWLHDTLYKKHQQLQQQQQHHHALLTKQIAQQIIVTSSPPGSSTGAVRKQIEGDTDSNSDTGLSSLHSSTEEGAYILDTLV